MDHRPGKGSSFGLPCVSFADCLKDMLSFFPFAFEDGILEFLIIAFLFTLLNLETAAERYIT